MNHYFKITIPCDSKLHELLIAELDVLNYDSFEEKEDVVEAFIQEKYYHAKQLKEILKKYRLGEQIVLEKLQDINWNKRWEKNFTPVYLEGQVQIRASFHEPKPGYAYDVVINPKMSFGTGHHETTSMMVEEQLKIDHKNKQILDVGTGTGILSIVANKLGATFITATDIDDWCIDNCKENFALNSISNFEILKGSVGNLTLKGPYDIILANINKNILLNEIPKYSELIRDKGILLISGFYAEDMEDLAKKTASANLKLIASEVRNNWALMRLSPLYI